MGNLARWRVMSERSRERLDDFWELIDGILNAVLFVLIGLAVRVEACVELCVEISRPPRT